MTDLVVNDPIYLTGKPKNEKITIVVGAPGSGKTTYVMTHRQIGDLVWDWDKITCALGMLEEFQNLLPLAYAVNEAKKAIFAYIRKENKFNHIWIITSKIDKQHLEAMCNSLKNSKVVVMPTNMNECIRRGKNDPNGQMKDGRKPEFISSWFVNFKNNFPKIAAEIERVK
jgi:predicted kinase